MVTRRAFVAGSAALLGGGLVLPRAAAAAKLDWPAFEWIPFEAAHASAIPVVVAVHAEGNAASGAQEPVLMEVIAEAQYNAYVRFRLDFDSQRDAADKRNVKEPGTILAYLCDEEMAHVVGDADPQRIRRLFAKVDGA